MGNCYLSGVSPESSRAASIERSSSPNWPSPTSGERCGPVALEKVWSVEIAFNSCSIGSAASFALAGFGPAAVASRRICTASACQAWSSTKSGPER